MPAGTSLFGVSSEGRVYVLSTCGSRWHELDYLGIEFKHVSAVPNCVWAVGGDRQIYLHVHGLDIPIRIKEESYENQRWLPLGDGFSARLLPTDRFHYSNVDGTIDRSWNLIELPSRAWAWESDWHIETVMDDGQPLDHEGWMYAIDFPASYTPQKHWNSCVRRRKWVRYRRYVALNSWCALPPLHRDPTQEPFIDVSVGGHLIPSCEPGTLVVWAITVQGRVLFRNGLSAVSPEGSHWIGIPLLPKCEPAQLCVGPSGHVWCVLWDGRVLVRDLISRDQLQGDKWEEVTPPEVEGEVRKLKQVAVGMNAVWAVASDCSVWFRRGVHLPDRPAGSGWVQMVGEMAQVSIGADNQVWAVGADDRAIYFRSNVVPEELTGRTWRKVHAGVRKIRADRASTSSSAGSSSGINMAGPSPTRHHVHHLGTSAKAYVEKPGSSFIHRPSSKASSKDSHVSAPNLAGSLDNLTIQDNQAADVSALIAGEKKEGACSSLPSNYIPGHARLRSLQGDSTSRSLSQLESQRLSGAADSSSETDSVFEDEEELFVSDFMPRLVHETDDLSQQSWNWVAAGACTIDPNQPPTFWFSEANNSKSLSKITEPWRNKIIEELRSRCNRETSGFDSYEKAIETTSWVKSGRAKVLSVLFSKGGSYDECMLELEWVEYADTDSAGTLSILSPDKAATKLQMSLSELSVIMVTSEPGIPRLTLHESRCGARATLTKGQQPIFRPYLQFTYHSEKDLEDWQDNFNTACCQLQGTTRTPSPEAIWATTSLGDIFVWDPVTMIKQQTSQKEGVFRQELASSSQPVPCEAQLCNAFLLGSAIEIKGRPYSNADRMAFNLQSFWGHCPESSKNIALHLNPRFKEEKVIRNSMDAGLWGMEEREGGFPFEREVEFCLRIECHTDCFVISVDGQQFSAYKHRLRPEHMGFIAIQGAVRITSIIYESKKLSIAPSEMFWRQIGGHLKKVETSGSGIVWGIGYDGRAWVYTKGWGIGCLTASSTESGSAEGCINSMTDSQCYHIYENQRWNPLTGYSARGLPTDRPPWSDKTGRYKRSKEKIRLRSMHWQWLTDWRVDFHVAGGVDKEGWQYAVDFPASYHGKKKFTDYVRRRRWERRCGITTSGPWVELGGTKLADVTLLMESGVTTVWAVAVNGDALYRCGVTDQVPMGENWHHVSGEHPLCGISLGTGGKLWAVGRNGSAFWRFGVNTANPIGEAWVPVDPPGPLQQISVGRDVWALDREKRVYLRREVTTVFPEGTHWLMTSDGSDSGSREVRQISCGPTGLWAALGNGDEPGLIGLRCGITDKTSSGMSWNFATSTGWQHVSARGWKGNTNYDNN